MALVWSICVLIVLSDVQVYLDRPKPKKKAKKKAKKTTFYNSPEWKRLKYRVLCRYEATCMCCGASRITGAEIHVDHVLPRSKFPDLALDIDNMQVLCRDCNLAKSNIDVSDWRKP